VQADGRSPNLEAMDLDQRQEFSEEQRAQFEQDFRRHYRIQLLCVAGSVVFYLCFLVVALVYDFWDAYWPIGLGLMLLPVGYSWRSTSMNNRCPACDHCFTRQPPSRSRKICPSCGSQLIN
jgi:hypothetical protein